MNDRSQFDVIILGSGLAGSLLATVLGKQGLKVLLVDKRVHPRFAIGEAMTPDTDLMMKILAHQYSVPEIEHLSSFESICQQISPSSCGLKRSFNFIYHQEGEEQTLSAINKLGVHSSSHLFRQDIDYYMAKVAVKYGVQLLENTKIEEFEIDENGVTITSDRGKTYTAKYIVDGSGYNSLIGRQYNLREQPSRFKTHSRTMFTHMVGVKRYDNCLEAAKHNTDGLHWYQGTLHHIFDGGWMWVIPFNNHDRSNNPICSVGINFDSRRFPKTELDGEAEFQQFLNKFPAIALQFESARTVRPWISTRRLQYSSSSCMGERYYLLPHASGFIDPLYSFGLVNSCTIMIPLAERIMRAVNYEDYDPSKFADLAQLQQKLLDYNDNLVNCSYIAFRDYQLWDAWRRIWILGSAMRQWKAGVKKAIKINAGKGAELSSLELDNNLDYLTPSFAGLGDGFFSTATSIMERVEQNELSPQDASQQILALIQAIDFLPPNYLGLGDEANKNLDIASEFGELEQKRFLFWVKSSSKPEVKRFFDYDMKDLVATFADAF